LNAFATAGCIRRQYHIRLVVNDGSDPFPEKRVIVDAQDPDLCLIGHLPPITVGVLAQQNITRSSSFSLPGPSF
jgi:hypothetical protein